MSIRRFSILALAALALWPAVADAQVLNRPQRAYRGLFGGNRPTDPNRTRQELSLSVNALGGYDDNAAVAGEGGTGAPPAPSLTPNGGGSTATFDAMLNYFVGKTARSFTLDVGGGTATYRNVPRDPSRSFTLNTSGRTTLGERASVTASENLTYSNQLRIDAPLTDALPIEDVPTTDTAVFGLGNGASISSNTSASLEYRVSRDGGISGSYSYGTTEFTDSDLGGYSAHRGSAHYTHQLTRRMEATTSYEYSSTRFGSDPLAGGRPMTENRVSGGLSWEKRLSPRRTLSVSAEGGAFHVESVTGEDRTPYALWAPFAEFSADLDVSRDWNLGANYRRGADTLEGLTTEAFLNDNATVSLSGLLTRRIDLAIVGGVARGASAGADGDNGSYLTTTASTQLRFALSRMFSAIVSYHYYHYDFQDTVLPEGVAPQFDRNAVRVGVSVWLPLFGRYDRAQ